VDFVIIEAGMGGENDATNVLKPILSIITPISLEHQEYLGKTLEEIATDKAGIIKTDSMTLISDRNPHLKEVFIQKAESCNNNLHFLDDMFTLEASESTQFQHSKVVIRKVNSNINLIFLPPFHGAGQANNVMAAYAAITLLSKFVNIDEKVIKKGVKYATRNFKFRGRFEIFQKHPLIILDVAHNPAAFEDLVENIKKFKLKNQMNLVLALMSDKDIDSIANIVTNNFSEIILTKPNIERAADPEVLDLKLIEHLNKSEMVINTDLKAIVKSIKKSAFPTLFAGSFYLIGEVLEIL
jgi:dihydrofolate synthase/folylpolyglutamate synthase